MVRSTSKRRSGALLAALLGAALAAAPSLAAAEEGETPELWEPEQAVAFLLGGPAPAPAAAEPAPAPPWDGALGGGVARALFGTYRVVLASQDLPVCAFRPSCSHFAERA
ncbi:MAG TPA: hypothetical protein VHO06_13380, partial [Polyangia bacterium]|nr:hypothetical protein [Polyangia bacterium]